MCNCKPGHELREMDNDTFYSFCNIEDFKRLLGPKKYQTVVKYKSIFSRKSLEEYFLELTRNFDWIDTLHDELSIRIALAESPKLEAHKLTEIEINSFRRSFLLAKEYRRNLRRTCRRIRLILDHKEYPTPNKHFQLHAPPTSKYRRDVEWKRLQTPYIEDLS